MRDAVAPVSYRMAPYVKVVGEWQQRQRLAQLRTGWHWLAVEADRREAAALPRHHSACQRCNSSEVDDEAHLAFWCAALSVLRREHASPFCRGLRTFLVAWDGTRRRWPQRLSVHKKDKELKTCDL